MRVFLCTGLLALFCVAAVPLRRLEAATLRENNQSLYFWKATPVGDTAQLVTLFCHSCQKTSDSEKDIPLLAVLRDTLNDNDPENDRILYIWLLSYARPNIGQRILSAVPFFYWRVGKGSDSVSAHDTSPLLDLTAPQHRVISEIGRDILQWTMLDPTPIRATSRAYRTNEIDDERVHLEEAIGYLREAPASDDSPALTQGQLNLVRARLELRERLLGGLVNQRRAARLGEESGFEQERIRSRNWELLRQCAEKTGLIFEPLQVAGTTGQYAMLWFPLQQQLQVSGTSVGPIWKLLNIKNPWDDARLKQWRGESYSRGLDENGSLLPAGTEGGRQVQLLPLGVYSLNYPRMPLLLVDFRDKLHVRAHEMTQRTINEVTSGVIGISHFTNWYYYVAADVYNFLKSRHGGAMDQAARLDCYSQFRVELALDDQLDTGLRKAMQHRVDALAVNPLAAAPEREMQAAVKRYARLEAEAQDPGPLMTRMEKARRAELATFGETKKARVAETFLHDASFGLYTHRAKEAAGNLATLDCYRRVEYHLNLLDSLVEAGTQPEITYASSRIQSSVKELSELMPRVQSAQVRAHVQATLERLRGLSQDEVLQADCSLALATLQRDTGRQPVITASGVVASPHGVTTVVPSKSAESFK